MPSLLHWKLPKSRSGRRPLKVSTLLDREKSGKLFHKQGGVDVDKWYARLLERRGETPSGKLKKAYADQIPGGLADNKKPSDFSQGALAKGIKVELEHTNRRDLAREIAMDHLTEMKDYYDKLEKMEGKEKDAIATHDQTYIDGDDPGVTGLAATARRRRLETPPRDEVDPNPTPKVEERGNIAQTTIIGGLAPAGGFEDVGKVSGKLEPLGQLSRSWEVPSDDSPSPYGSSHRAGVGGLVESPSPSRTAVEEEMRGPLRFSLSDISTQASQDEATTKGASAQFPKMSGVEDNTVMSEATIKLANAFAQGFECRLRELVAAELEKSAQVKEAIGFGGLGQGLKSFAGKLMPGAGAAVMPEVAAMRKGTGFFSTGIGSGLHQGGKMLAHNAPAAGQAAGLAAKDVSALQAMRPTSMGRRIAGETAIGTGHHLEHAGPALMAFNPVGVPMGGAIEGFTRGVGKEMQRAGNQAVQSAGHTLVRHAPKIGYGGEMLAGSVMPVTGLAGLAGHQLGGAVAHHLGGAAAHQLGHGLGAHALGAGVQEASMAAPRLVPRVGQAVMQGAMGLKARAGHIGGKLVGA